MQDHTTQTPTPNQTHHAFRQVARTTCNVAADLLDAAVAARNPRFQRILADLHTRYEALITHLEKADDRLGGAE